MSNMGMATLKNNFQIYYACIINLKIIGYLSQQVLKIKKI